jgi:hypothetical protein
LDSAANFLIAYVCAAEIASATRYEMNLSIVDSFGAMGTAFSKPAAAGKAQSVLLPSAMVDPETGDIVVPKQTGDASPQSLMAPMIGKIGNNASQFSLLMAPASLRRLAGALVLEARERQLTRGR